MAVITGTEARVLVTALQRLSETLRERALDYLRQCGHVGVKTRYLDLLSALPVAGIRPTLLAGQLVMHPQHCLDLVSELEGLGYLRRGADPSDRRASLVQRTSQGSALLRDSQRFGQQLDQHYRPLLTEGSFSSLQQVVAHLYETIADTRPETVRAHYLQQSSCLLFEQLVVMDAYCRQWLSQQLQQRGVAPAGETMSWLLRELAPQPTTLVELALRRGISAQALGRVVQEAEQLGYLERSVDPSDRRRRLLQLSETGRTYQQQIESLWCEPVEGFRQRLSETQWQTFVQGVLTLADQPLSLSSAPAPVMDSPWSIEQRLLWLLQQIDPVGESGLWQTGDVSGGRAIGFSGEGLQRLGQARLPEGSEEHGDGDALTALREALQVWRV